MKLNTSSSSLDNAEAKPAFRKPSNDTNTRHYRRRSPIGGSSSSDRSSSPIHSRENSRRGSMRRKDDEKDLDRDSGRIHQGRSGDTYRKSDQKFSKSSYDNHRRDTFDRRDRVIDADERHYSKSSSHSGRESRSVTGFDHAREENEHYKSKRISHRDDKYSCDKTVGYGHTSRDKDIDEKEYRRGDKKFSRSPVRSSGSLRDKAEHRSKDRKDLDDQKYAKEEKRKLGDHETSKQIDWSDKHSKEQLKERIVFTSEKEDSPAKKQKPVLSAGEAKSEQLPASGHAPAIGCTAADIDAARKTAMKAAESVNKNLMGTGYMSADQKKKLLWGKKNSTPAEEQSIHRWDTATFSDREQQEKFNKLMGVKVEVKADPKTNNQECGSEKHKEVLLDLEKQYVAGLRRRDGRTVGLGL